MESSLEEFSTRLTSLTMEANRDFIKCKDLGAFLDENAELLEQTHQTLTYGIARSIINNMLGLQLREDLKGYGSAEVMHREYKNVLAGLLGDDSKPVIKLLAERAAVCWLRLQAAERYYNRIHEQTSIPIQTLEWANKQLTMGQNRFVQACDALARMRLLREATRIVEARADLAEAKAEEAGMNKSKAAMRLLKSATG